MNHKKIRRLMREHDLQPKIRRRFIAMTDSDDDAPRAKNGPALAGHGAEAVRDGIMRTMITLPEALRRSLIWDQGAETAQHDRLKIDAGVHLVLMPIFYEGRLAAWAAMFGHMTDTGGRVPGSLPTDAQQIFEEGSEDHARQSAGG